jgi:3-deoxy-D-manno-octulosonate 8-phosphate phosphatase (KDO 8-P phosphatase)
MARLAEVRLLSLDVDGVLTDGGLYFTDDGGQLRKFNARDGVGIKRVKAMGVELAIVTASRTEAIRSRAEWLGVDHVFMGDDDKLATISALCRELHLDLVDIAHVGDDLNDVALLMAVGCPLTVADAVPEAVAAALYVTERQGGDGAVREICDLLVAGRGGD